MLGTGLENCDYETYELSFPFTLQGRNFYNLNAVFWEHDWLRGRNCPGHLGPVNLFPEEFQKLVAAKGADVQTWRLRGPFLQTPGSLAAMEIHLAFLSTESLDQQEERWGHLAKASTCSLTCSLIQNTPPPPQPMAQGAAACCSLSTERLGLCYPVSQAGHLPF
jgi:hypothetical protein